MEVEELNTGGCFDDRTCAVGVVGRRAFHGLWFGFFGVWFAGAAAARRRRTTTMTQFLPAIYGVLAFGGQWKLWRVQVKFDTPFW